jgi:hypothetical protein
VGSTFDYLVGTAEQYGFERTSVRENVSV